MGKLPEIVLYVLNITRPPDASMLHGSSTSVGFCMGVHHQNNLVLSAVLWQCWQAGAVSAQKEKLSWTWSRLRLSA